MSALAHPPEKEDNFWLGPNDRNCALRDQEARITNCRPACLLNRASYFREYIISIRTDQPNRAHHDDQDDRQHDCIFRDVLTAFVGP